MDDRRNLTLDERMPDLGLGPGHSTARRSIRRPGSPADRSSRPEDSLRWRSTCKMVRMSRDGVMQDILVVVVRFGALLRRILLTLVIVTLLVLVVLLTVVIVTVIVAVVRRLLLRGTRHCEFGG